MMITPPAKRVRKRAGTAIAALAGLLVCAATAGAVSGTDTISTIAGNGTKGFSGDNGQATAAQLNAPLGVAIDPLGRTLIADFANQRVRRVATNGVITTMAGNPGTPPQGGFSGDNGPATAAQLNLPYDVVADGAGNVFINDQNNNRIRKVAPNGTITTFAMVTLPQGLDVDPAGNLFVVQQPTSTILRITPTGAITTVAGNGSAGFSGDNGPAPMAQLQFPKEVAVGADGASLLIADFSNNRVRQVAPNGIITTIAGTGTAGFNGDDIPAVQAQLDRPVGVEQDAAGNVYISDSGNRRVRKVSPNGIITTVAGNGTATPLGDGGQARQAAVGPNSLYVDGQGSLLIGDSLFDNVRKVTNLVPSAALAAFPTSGGVPLTVAFDGSGSTDPNGTIISHSWDFGDGTSGSGARVSHTYGAAGSFTARLTVRDDSGATATRTQAIAVGGAPPPPLQLTGAQFSVRWRASRLRPGRLVLTGGVARQARLRVQLRRGKKVVLNRVFSRAAGPFVQRVRLPARLLPGSYLVRLLDATRGNAARLPTRELRAKLKPPREGVVANAFISTKIGGRPLRRIRETRTIIFAHFPFVARPKRGQRLTVSWFPPGSRRPVATDRKASRPTIVAFITNGRPLPRGRWRAQLRYGGKLVATASTRLG
jgi:PKD repeat protein